MFGDILRSQCKNKGGMHRERFTDRKINLKSCFGFTFTGLEKNTA